MTFQYIISAITWMYSFYEKSWIHLGTSINSCLYAIFMSLRKLSSWKLTVIQWLNVAHSYGSQSTLDDIALLLLMKDSFMHVKCCLNVLTKLTCQIEWLCKACARCLFPGHFLTDSADFQLLQYCTTSVHRNKY